MRIDFINDGSHDGPLIRLMTDDCDEITVVQNALRRLGKSETDTVVISDLPFSKSKIALSFKRSETDSGIVKVKEKLDYILSMTSTSFMEMAEKLNPFLPGQEGFIWLYESKNMYLLFTTDGYW